MDKELRDRVWKYCLPKWFKEAEEYAEKEMENVSSWEWDSEYVQGLIEHAWYEGANFALGKQEKDGIDLKKLNEMLDDTLKKETKESLNQWLSEKDADTVTINKGKIL